MAHPTGFEPVIPGFVDRCLIQFGHGCREQRIIRNIFSVLKIFTEFLPCANVYWKNGSLGKVACRTAQPITEKRSMDVSPDGIFMAAAELMAIGMSTVFLFLSLLVGATQVMSWSVRALYPADEQPNQESPDAPASRQQRAHLAAISAALALHRKRVANEENDK